MTVADFNEAYRGVPPWEVDMPQPAVVALAEEDAFTGRVLDVGCGTGENSLYLASRGLSVLGIDAAPAAVARARGKAAERGLPGEFTVADAFDLGALGRHFDTVLDSAFLHILGARGDADRRSAYATQLALVLPAGGRLHLLQISELTTGEFPRISRAQIVQTFTDGWALDRIQAAIYATNRGDAPAWLVSLHRR
ncbi:MAG TPA: methyltransferase domain-containing protein [Pseudonocardiaceae bacterium]|nr:methyltransferase domain-containing protein [Pseudonocardiaceae bacterium]